jgi:hypothetical protein
MSDKSIKLQPLFEMIDKAGGPKLPDIKLFNSKERTKVVFNIWAFLFTIFYYFYHGMWKKSIVLFLISIVLIVLLETFIPSLSSISWIVTSAIFATRANIDLYKKYKLGDAGWI